MESESYGFAISASGSVLVSNCSVINNGAIGFWSISGTYVAKNCLASGNATDFSGAFNAASTNNASSDGTAKGTNPRINQTFTFVDEANDDYHLAHSDRGAWGQGIDLSSDATFPFDDDIDGDVLSIWSIGADNPVQTSSRRRASHEVISTYGNGTRDYTSLNTWEADWDIDCVAGQVSPVLECYDDAVFDDYVVIAGATTDAS
jgi:hypothetical protein